MNAIILAAGMGTRLKSLTAAKPKALIAVAGKTLIEHVVDMARFTHAEKIIVVAGSHFDLVRSFVAEHYPSDQIITVENADYRKGNLFSLQAALPLVTSDFFLFNVDHVFSRGFMEKALALARAARHFTVFCDRQKPIVPDQMKVQEEAGRLKVMGKQIVAYNTGYTGLDYCPAQSINFFSEAVRVASQDQGDNAVKEDAINRLARVEDGVCAADVSGNHWFEVDTPKDLVAAEQLVGQTRDQWI